MLMLLTGCNNGRTNYLNVSPEFLDGLMYEYPTIVECCPYTNEVIKDWIAQNEPLN